MVYCNHFSLPQGSSPLARTASIGQVSPLGIEPLGPTIRVKEADRNAGLCGTGGDQLLCRIHQVGGDPLPLELREDE